MIMALGMVAAILGFFIALYIYRKQESKKPLMCPRRAPCETVLNSPEAKMLGISNSILGMVYYAIMLFLLVCLQMGGESGIAEIVLFVIALVGFGFSGYLVWVQHSKIKQWCAWCLGSALMATALLVVAVLLL